MNVAEFIIELLDKLVWPIAVIVLVLLLRQQIIRLLENLRSLKYKDLSLEFGQQLEEAKGEAEKAHLPQVSEDVAKEKMEYYKELALISPRAVVLEAWLQVETAVEGVIRRRADKPRIFRPEAKMLLKLAELEEWEISILDDLRSIRNRIVHQEDARLSKDQAIEYAHLALRLASKIREKFNS